MGIESFFVVPIEIQQPVIVTDRYGNPQEDWDNATKIETTGWLQDLSSYEALGNRDTISVSSMLYLATGTDINAHDRVVADGVTYEVDGVPKIARTPLGEHHLEATLRVFDDSRGGGS